MSGLTVDQILFGPDLGLGAGLSDLLAIDIGGRRVLYALSRSENRLIEIDIADDGTLTPGGYIDLAGTFPAGSKPLLSPYATDANPSALLIAGQDASSGQYVSLNADGTLGTQEVWSGVGRLVAQQSFILDGDTALISGRDGGGLDLFLDSGAGLVWAAGLDDTASTYLAGISASVLAGPGPKTFIIAASATENGVTVAEVETTGTLSLASSFGIAEGLPVNAPSDLAEATRLGTTQVILASAGSSSLSVLELLSDGGLLFKDHILDVLDTRFQSVQAIDSEVVGDFAFVSAAGAEGGVSLFTILPAGRLVHLATIADSATTTLYRANSVVLSQTDSTLQILAASEWEIGLTRLSYDISALGSVLTANTDGSGITGTSGDDQVIGSVASEVLEGAGGADIIFDSGGADTLTGGAGADLFIFQADANDDWVTDFDRAEDRLDLSGFAFLYDVDQLQMTETVNGATLSFGDETVHLTASNLLPITAGELTNDMILNVSRPPALATSQELSGGPLNDTIVGAAGNDTILGASGDDILMGQGGADLLHGGQGADQVDGESGNDTIEGGAGSDTLVGGIGDDLIIGGADGDLIYADEFDWSLA